MIAEFLNREAQVIEVNIEPALKVGNTINVIGPCQEILPAIFKHFTSKSVPVKKPIITVSLKEVKEVFKPRL